MHDIAKECGCSVMTVSYALRDKPKVSAETKSRIQAVARKLGYKPDPSLSALVSYRGNVSSQSIASPLAWISATPQRDDWLHTDNFVLHYYQAACKRAAEYGYRVERFWLGEPGITPKRLSQILYSRGVTGLLVAPQPRPNASLDMEWDHFSAVTFGHTLAVPQLHMASTHHSNLTLTALHHIRDLGYRRVGLYINRIHDMRVAHNFVGPFLADQMQVAVENRIPPYCEPDFSWDNLHAWLDQWKPDCLLVSDSYAVKVLQQRDRGTLPPMGIVTLEYNAQYPVSGMSHNFPSVGEAAVDLLVKLIRRGETGIPSVRQSILVNGSWIEDHSLATVTG
ncbi:MAG: LacI family DNA-binding transcriptional regulator [Opitutaceae bacterium]